ncbi:CRISPR-associated protein csx8 [Peptoanaerobacter stomatis]|uniref:CRISPR-associated protein csx8 n=1 Tax=Peptoanaerobacter stomatis TaxID=796937 RepID=G9XBZ6_9FIRM|nr:type I CRISPR-associated protein Cas8a1/Csx8 [Peptoanaerobacter stomatis]EHL19483.1 CRISPR-associated protein csx8 [Peptoanaerobacter stomatis]
MISTGNYGKYDTSLEFSDWRFSASAVGIMKYLQYNDMDFYIYDYDDEENDYEYKKDAIYYNKKDILDENKYLDFAEHFFSDKFHHKRVIALLDSDNFDTEKIKRINDTLKANVIMKKIFANIKFNGENKDEIINLIQDNKYEIIKETYRNAKSMYANFCNINSIFSNSQEICRLLGYNVDLGKKKKSLGFNWNYDTYVYNDVFEFDYIPFAFTRTRDVFFINNNFNAKELLKSNENIDLNYFNDNEKKNIRKELFFSSSKNAKYIDYEVEIISKQRDYDYFETMFIRDEAIRIFNAIDDMKDENIVNTLSNPCKYGKSDYLPILNIVVDSIINLLHLDPLIDKLLKDFKNDHWYLISQLIRINILLYKENYEIMENKGDKSNKIARVIATANEVNKKLRIDKSNKIISYKNKLISCLVFKDYDRFCSILLQLATYSSVSFGFAYDLFEDFEKNKNLAYAFVNSLNFKEFDQNKEENKNEK